MQRFQLVKPNQNNPQLGPGAYEPEQKIANYRTKESTNSHIRRKLKATSKWPKLNETVPSIPAGNKMIMLSDDEDEEKDSVNSNLNQGNYPKFDHVIEAQTRTFKSAE